MIAVLPHPPTDHPTPTPTPTATAQPYLASQLLTITTHPAPPAATVLTIHGEIDALTSTQLTNHLLPHMRDTIPHVIVDLTNVNFFAAAGLTALINAQQTATAAGTTLYLVASTRPVLLPLTITGLNNLFDISPNLTHALLRAGCGPDG